MKTKRLFILGLVLAFAGIIHAADILKVQDVQVESGKDVTLNIELNNETTNLMGWQCDISLPEGLTLELKANGKPVATLGDRFKSTEHSISSNYLANGDYRFIATSIDGDAIPGTSGTLFSVTLKADASLTAGTKLTATVKNIELNTQNNKKISLDDFTFIVTITGGDTPGGDTPGGDTPGGDTPGGDTPGGDTPGGDTPSDDTSINVLRVSDVSLEIGEDVSLDILLDNEATNLMGWQCDISLPKGLTLELKENGKPAATLGERFKTTEHKISSNCLANGDYRFIATSIGGEAIPGTSGILFSVTLKADESLVSNGKLTATIKNIEFNTQNNKKISLDDLTFSVTVSGGETPEEDAPKNVLKVSDVNLARGWNKSVEVLLDNETANLMGWQCDITLPEGLTLELNEKGKPDAVLSERFSTTGHSISSSCLANGDYRFIATSIDGEAIPGTSGALFSITLKADASLTPGTSLTAIVKNIEFNTQDNRKITFDDVKFLVVIKRLGDVNCDGEVDALDIEEIANALMGKPSENYNPEYADVNNDQKVNAADIVALVNIIQAQ